MKRVQWPTPEQIGAYLCAHGWRFDRPMKQPGAVYVYHQLSDTGKPVEVFVPYYRPQSDEIRDFATSVLAVAETVESFEGRDRETILAEMLATEVASRTPPIPAA